MLLLFIFYFLFFWCVCVLACVRACVECLIVILLFVHGCNLLILNHSHSTKHLTGKFNYSNTVITCTNPMKIV